MFMIANNGDTGPVDRKPRDDCVDFLQWCLPRLGYCWRGYRRVRGTVCRRSRRRARTLGLSDLSDYRRYLEHNDAEWSLLDSLCRIPISRFYRDRAVFDALGSELLPELAACIGEGGATRLRCWCAGCASGEEPYTLALIAQHRLRRRMPGITLDIIATDADEGMLERARRGLYRDSSLRELPKSWRAQSFTETAEGWRLTEEVRSKVRFERQDLRVTLPGGAFDLVLCRNLVFTYFDVAGQKRFLEQLTPCLHAGSLLVIGGHERLPEDCEGFEAALGALPIYRFKPAVRQSRARPGR
jgi:chemotaxis protein methyltransferase CheR